MAKNDNDIEMQARQLNDADKKLREAMEVYISQGYTYEEFTDRLEDLQMEYDLQFK